MLESFLVTSTTICISWFHSPTSSWVWPSSWSSEPCPSGIMAPSANCLVKNTIMTKEANCLPVLLAWAVGSADISFQVSLLLKCPFCTKNIADHFFCDAAPAWAWTVGVGLTLAECQTAPKLLYHFPSINRTGRKLQWKEWGFRKGQGDPSPATVMGKTGLTWGN